MAFIQKQKVEENAVDAAQGGDAPPKRTTSGRPVMHVHKDASGRLKSMHFLGDEADAPSANPHLDNLLKKLEDEASEAEPVAPVKRKATGTWP